MTALLVPRVSTWTVHTALAPCAFMLAACGAYTEEIASTNDPEVGNGTKVKASAQSHDGDRSSRETLPRAEPTPASAIPGGEANNDPTLDLARHKSVSPQDSKLPLPQCFAPLSAKFGYPTFGTEAVRLLWKPESGECRFDSGDATPADWSGIVTLRHHDQDLFLSGIGDWRYYAPKDLDLDALPSDQTLTFYPYLGDWQFVIDISYDDDAVTIERFEYIAGDPPENFGLPDETSNDPVADSMLVPCSSLSNDGEDQETQAR
ncbi:MAG TPA: hypothetical protein VHM70_25520 [Polyangiaceae bacterium]|jgi:hypothetical protein|nr:hypothetical protein [Polyangiaceae bacterium]